MKEKNLTDIDEMIEDENEPEDINESEQSDDNAGYIIGSGRKRVPKILLLMENIVKNFPTILLGAFLFFMIFTAYFIIRDKLFVPGISYGAKLYAKPLDENGKPVNLSVDDLYDAVSSKEVRDAITESIAVDVSYKEFIKDLTISLEDGAYVFTFFDKDSNFACSVVSKFFESASFQMLKKGKVDSFEVTSPANFVINAKGRRWTQYSIVSFMLMGAVSGFIFTVVMISIFFLIDTTLKDEDDVERYLGLYVLTTIPVNTGRKKGEENE